MINSQEAEGSTPHDRAANHISVINYIENFHVEDSQTIEVLNTFPTLCYLLGKVSSDTQPVIHRPTRESLAVRLLKEGSGMFGLTDKQDAMAWRGIFNHIVGSVRHTEFLIDMLCNATPEQRSQLEAKGYDFTSFDQYGKENIFDFMLVSHAGRRAADEHNWYGIQDNAHLTGDSYQNTRSLLTTANAPSEFLELLEIENHAELMSKEGKTGRFLNIAVALLTYADWTFGQNAIPLSERFSSLRKTQRASEEHLNVFENCSTAFEKDMNLVFGKDLFAEMNKQKSKPWEAQVQNAYGSSSGLPPQEVFSSN